MDRGLPRGSTPQPTNGHENGSESQLCTQFRREVRFEIVAQTTVFVVCGPRTPSQGTVGKSDLLAIAGDRAPGILPRFPAWGKAFPRTVGPPRLGRPQKTMARPTVQSNRWLPRPRQPRFIQPQGERPW